MRVAGTVAGYVPRAIGARGGRNARDAPVPRAGRRTVD